MIGVLRNSGCTHAFGWRGQERVGPCEPKGSRSARRCASTTLGMYCATNAMKSVEDSAVLDQATLKPHSRLRTAARYVAAGLSLAWLSVWVS